MQLFYQPNISIGDLFLNPKESRHAIKVLRHKSGDDINVTDGKGWFFRAKITDANYKKCHFKLLEKKLTQPKDYYLHIALAPTKNIDRIEWFVEKAVEIGIDEISFIICENSERKIIKIERVQKKAISAMKQSLKTTLPIINESVAFNTFLHLIENQQKYIAYVDFSNPKTLFKQAEAKQKYCVLIGPEGDFSENELNNAIEQGFLKASLGKSRLRTETAAITACHTLNLINE